MCSFPSESFLWTTHLRKEKKKKRKKKSFRIYWLIFSEPKKHASEPKKHANKIIIPCPACLWACTKHPLFQLRAGQGIGAGFAQCHIPPLQGLARAVKCKVKPIPNFPKMRMTWFLSCLLLPAFGEYGTVDDRKACMEPGCSEAGEDAVGPQGFSSHVP